MSLYRCAICGSPRLTKTSEKSGFSYGKAVAGTAVFGAVGAIAGLDGKKTDVYKCPDCGHTMAEPMDFATQNAIDMCVMDSSVRHQYNWEILKRKYINIESGYGDKRVAEAASGLEAAVQAVIDEVNEEYEYYLSMTEEQLSANEKYVAAKKAPYDEKIEQEVKLKIEKAKSEFSSKQSNALAENAERLEKTKTEMALLKAELNKQPQSQKKQKTMKIITLLIFVFMMAAVITLNSSPIIADKEINNKVESGIATVCSFAIVFLIIKMRKNKKKIKNEPIVREEKEKTLASKEKLAEELEKKLDDIKNNPNALYELRIPDAEFETRKLRREMDYPLLVPARLRIQDHNKLTRDQQNEVDGTLMVDMVLRIFRKYGGEIRNKKIKEIMTKVIPDGLHEDRYRLLSYQKIYSFFDDVKPNLELRVERSKDPGEGDYDVYLNGSYSWHYYHLK